METISSTPAPSVTSPATTPDRSAGPAPSLGGGGASLLGAAAPPNGGPNGVAASARGSAGGLAVDQADDRSRLAGIQTWDRAAGGWLAATGARGSQTVQVKGADKPDDRLFADLAYGNPMQERAMAAAIGDGRIARKDLGGLDRATVARINPKSAQPANILQSALDESWHVAKDVLTKPAMPEGSKNYGEDQQKENFEARKDLMWKIWEFRQWDHEEVLKSVKEGLPKRGADPHAAASPYPGLDFKAYFPMAGTPLADDALSKWSAAGSVTLTSDIDVNLKGAATELAVPAFNIAFKQPRMGFKFNNEPGVTYDVNVYALDFMHGAGMEVGAGTDKHLEVGREFGSAVMGPKKDSPDQEVKGRAGLADPAKAAQDSVGQEVAAQVKMRRYMTAAEWEKYKTDLIAAAAANSTEAARKMSDSLARAEAGFLRYMSTMLAEMKRGYGPLDEGAERALEDGVSEDKSGVEQLNEGAEGVAHARGASGSSAHAKAEQAVMGASNRIYERMLTEVAQLRSRCKLLQAQLDGAQVSDRRPDDVRADLDAQYALLREKLSEAALYANEAYVTDGAVNHTVVGLQIGRPVQQQRNELLHAVIENHADVRKEISRHSSWLGEAAYKSGKYAWRLAEAARQLGLTGDPVEPLFDAGYTIANEIKGKGGDPEVGSNSVMFEKLGIVGIVGTPSGIPELVGKATEVARLAQAEVVARPDGLAAPVNAKRH